MRVVRLPADEGERQIIWQHVTGIHYEAEGRSRWLVVTYRNGSTRRLQPHQARDLWHAIEEHRGCPAPCYYRWECDSSPTDCMSCQLAQALAGVDCEVRPAPIPPRRTRPADVRTWLIAVLVGLVVLLIAVADAARQGPVTVGVKKEVKR